MAFFAYMLVCVDGAFYVGHTDNMEQRLSQHESGKIDGYTAARLPVKLVWYQSFQERNSAFIVERKIKGWSRAKKEALIVQDWQTLSELCSRAKKI